MEYLKGITLIIIAGIFQGAFIYPMTKTKKWEWENTWFVFALFGMIILNWGLALFFIPNIFSIFLQTPTKDLIILALFGLGWGTGAVLFGIGMDKLGMSLGYPIIQGLVACLGSLLPMLIFNANSLLTLNGSMLLMGTFLVVVSIIISSRAASIRDGNIKKGSSKSLLSGIVICILAGILCSFPNVGLSFSGTLNSIAEQNNVSATNVGNVVWALFFTVGFFANLGYTLYLMAKRNSFNKFKNYFSRNLGLGIIMAALWICSFYFYGRSVLFLGKWGAIVGWPMFISLSILVGNILGIIRGEWKGTGKKAQKTLAFALFGFVISLVFIGLSNYFQK